jgi:hypothetical protein
MTRWIAVMFLGLASVAFLAGCEWESSGSDSTWDDSMSWANFSGTYRDADGGALATTFGTSAGSSTQIVSVTGEVIGVGNEDDTVYSGTLDNTPVLGGSLVVQVASYILTDNGDGSLSGTADTTGTIDYGSGAWTINLGIGSVDDGMLITAAYRYTSGGSSGQVDQGNTGDPIYILTVTQTGNNLVMTDNNGAKYSGSIHSLSAPNGDATGGSSGAVQGNFEVSGNSASGARVTITGSLSGTYTAAVTATGSSGASASRAANMTDLKMEGTWVEDGGTSGDIRAVVQ